MKFLLLKTFLKILWLYFSQTITQEDRGWENVAGILLYQLATRIGQVKGEADKSALLSPPLTIFQVKRRNFDLLTVHISHDWSTSLFTKSQFKDLGISSEWKRLGSQILARGTAPVLM